MAVMRGLDDVYRCAKIPHADMTVCRHGILLAIDAQRIIKTGHFAEGQVALYSLGQGLPILPGHIADAEMIQRLAEVDGIV